MVSATSTVAASRRSNAADAHNANVTGLHEASLEETVKEQSEQIARLLSQSERAYGQVQEIAVRAIEGSGSAKQLANLQQLLAEQSRKGAAER